MKTLQRFELKKMVMRKETYLVCILLILYFVISTAVALQQHTYSLDGRELNGLEAVRVMRKAQNEYEGPLNIEKVSSLIAIHEFVNQNPEHFDAFGGLKDSVYFEHLQPLEGLNTLLSRVYSQSDVFDPYILKTLTSSDGSQFYDLYNEKLAVKGIKSQFSDEKPLYVGYHLGWQTLLQNLWIHGIVITLGMCILFSGLFASEVESKMDLLLNSVKQGKLPLNRIKLRNAFWLGTFMYVAFMGVYMAIIFILYGFNGHRVSLQAINLFSSLNINLLQASLLSLVVSYMSYLLFVALTIFLSKWLKRTLHTSIVILSALIMPIFIQIPEKNSGFQMALYILPSNAMNAMYTVNHSLYFIGLWILIWGAAMILLTNRVKAK